MKIKYRRLPNPEQPETFMLMGMAFVNGRHQMTGMPVKIGEDEKPAKKIIKRAFAKVRNSN